MEKKIDEFKAVAEWIQEELPEMIKAYKEKNTRIIEQRAKRIKGKNVGIFSDDVLSAIVNVAFSDKYFKFMKKECGRFLVYFERIVKDEDFEIRYIEED